MASEEKRGRVLSDLPGFMLNQFLALPLCQNTAFKTEAYNLNIIEHDHDRQDGRVYTGAPLLPFLILTRPYIIRM